MPDLAILVPTRGRPGNIAKVIEAWTFTNAWEVADLILIVDGDDPELEGYYRVRADHGPFRDSRPASSLVEMPEWMPMVHKLDLAAGYAAASGEYFALGFAGDDHLPRTINWAQTYLTNLRELGSGMVYGDDGYQGQNMSTEWAITSDVVRALGRMVPAPVEHMYSDASLVELMRMADMVRYLPGVRIEHMHPIVKKADNDEQYRRVNSRDQFAKDKALYARWQRDQRAVDLEAVSRLRPDYKLMVPDRRSRTAAPLRRTGDRRRSGPTERKSMSLAPKAFRYVRGATPDEIGVTLADLAMNVPTEQAIVELGVYQARTTLLMAWGARQGNQAHVWGVDAWDLDANTYGPPFKTEESRSWADHNVRATGYSDEVTLIQGFSVDQAAEWSGPLIGLLFVDDDHSYEGARNAVVAWAPHLADGATVAVDDYGHPDWPGVAQAVDELVDQGVLAPIQIFHERLAVTRVMQADWPGAKFPPGRTSDRGILTAITSEGVSPPPEQVYQEGIDSGLSHAEAQEDAWPTEGQNQFQQAVVDVLSGKVAEGELEGVAAATSIEDLNLVNLKALAKARGIVLGARKDLRDSILQALRDGR